jgi:hypothetical protein
MKKVFSLIFFSVTFIQIALAQLLYGLADGGGYTYVVQINTANCEVCPVLPIINDGNILDLAVLPNGNIITVGPVIRVYDPPSSIPISTLLPPVAVFQAYGVAVSSSGIIYLGGNGLSTYDPVTNTYTFIGSFPAAFPVLFDLFYVGTQLMGMFNNCPVAINTGNPILSTASGPCVTPAIALNGATYIPGSTIYVNDADDLFELDQATGTITSICDLAGLSYDITAIEFVPPSIPMPSCLCITNAGSVTSALITKCINQTATVPFNNDANLDGNDVLQYILFSNPSDTLGSIIATNNTGLFSFNPSTMQTGVAYYLATMAGNNLNGSVNPNDPCLDFSNAATLIWRPTPAVAFTVNTPNICAGNCQTINVTLTGTPPFTLTYNTSNNTGLTQIFSSNTGTISVCVPAGASVGSSQVIATSLVDALCGC